jgi:inorganic pyrophosphatase
MNIGAILPLDQGLVNAVIETPKGSQNKFAYDPRLDLFLLKKTLPMGTVFPFDFGFIPNTKGEDGDPLDILVIMDPDAFTGCLVKCRLLGVLEATQKEKGEKAIRNDRLVAVADASVLYSDIKSVKDLNKNMVKEIEQFFADYNRHEGKVFEALGWESARKAEKLVAEAIQV